MKELNQLEIMNQLLQMVAPGTPFGKDWKTCFGLRQEALIVVGYSPEVWKSWMVDFPSIAIFPRTICMSLRKWMEPLF